MRSLFISLSLLFALTACAPLSKDESTRGGAGENGAQQKQEKAKQQQDYDAWWQSLTPEQRAEEVFKQHERALSP
jgi:hypothetical protein